MVHTGYMYQKSNVLGQAVQSIQKIVSEELASASATIPAEDQAEPGDRNS
jgi:hypothetical protein